MKERLSDEILARYYEKYKDRPDLDEQGKIDYSRVRAEMDMEIEERNPAQYHNGGFDGKATRVYQEISRKYLPKIVKVFRETAERQEAAKNMENQSK